MTTNKDRFKPTYTDAPRISVHDQGQMPSMAEIMGQRVPEAFTVTIVTVTGRGAREKHDDAVAAMASKHPQRTKEEWVKRCFFHKEIGETNCNFYFGV